MSFRISAIEGKLGYLLLLASAAIPPVFGFVLAPLITAHVSPAEYGNYIAYQTLCAIVAVGVGLSSAGYISNAFIRPELAAEINASMLTLVVLTVPGVLVAAFLLNAGFQGHGAHIVLAMVVAGILTYVTSYFQAYATLLKRYGYLLVLAAVQFVTQAVLVVFFILGDSLSLDRLVLASIAGLVLAALVCLGPLRTRLGLQWVRPQKPTVRRIAIYGLPLMPHLLLSLATGSFDRWFLAKTDDVQFLAVYSVALSVAAPMYILLDVVNKIYSPLVFHRLRQGERAIRNFVVLALAFHLISIVSALAVGLAGYWFIHRFFGAQYLPAAKFCIPLCLSIAAFSLYYSAAPFLYYFNRTRLILVSSIAGSFTTVVVTIFAFPVFSADGLILGKALGFVCCGVLALALAQRVIRERAH